MVIANRSNPQADSSVAPMVPTDGPAPVNEDSASAGAVDVSRALGTFHSLRVAGRIQTSTDPAGATSAVTYREPGHEDPGDVITAADTIEQSTPIAVSPPLWYRMVTGQVALVADPLHAQPTALAAASCCPPGSALD